MSTAKVEYPYQNVNPQGLPGACSTCFTWHDDIKKRELCCQEKRCHARVFQFGKAVICNRDRTAHEHLKTECCGKPDHKFKELSHDRT